MKLPVKPIYSKGLRYNTNTCAACSDLYKKRKKHLKQRKLVTLVTLGEGFLGSWELGVKRTFYCNFLSFVHL